MAKAMITPDGDAVVSEIEIAARPDRIFQALTTREQALQWGANRPAGNGSEGRRRVALHVPGNRDFPRV